MCASACRAAASARRLGGPRLRQCRPAGLPAGSRRSAGARRRCGQSDRCSGRASGPPGGACDYSFIFTNGAYETIPGEASPLATKFGCGPRKQEEDVVDPKAGYVWDATRQDPGSDGWGHYPRSGRAQVYIYPELQERPRRRRRGASAEGPHRRPRAQRDRQAGEPRRFGLGRKDQERVVDATASAARPRLSLRSAAGSACTQLARKGACSGARCIRR